jgi:radical SAM/Cys-rich protein
MAAFSESLVKTGVGWPLKAAGIDLLQVNAGYRCNQTCRHCHLGGGPERPEMMTRETVEAVLRVAERERIGTLDITGGAPELNPHFRFMVVAAKEMGKRVIVRTNLTIFFEEGMNDLPLFFRDSRVEVVASLPHYSAASVDRIRGAAAFDRSIRALQKLNSLGYGMPGSGLVLNLVYNPPGALLPEPQKELEAAYRRELASKFGIIFTGLLVFANMPVGRFGEFLERARGLESYMGLIKRAFNPETLDRLMCRTLVNVGWDGRLYDCDFNQVLNLPVDAGRSDHISRFDYHRLATRSIVTRDHCFVCSAGQGSS